ncbi:MAG: 1-phosphofructokinase family hexose kinase [Chloroflexota bacterium]
MILCVTPNPAIDRSLRVSALRLGEVHRADHVLAAAGGKGLNVARTIRALGGEPFCMGLLGGHTGRLLADLAAQEGLPARWTQTAAETRTCVILVEQGRDATVVNERGAQVSESECRAFCRDVWEEAAARARLVCVSGSLPPGFPLNVFHDLLAGLVKDGRSVWVDTSGPALRAALTVRGVHIKVNAGELGEALGVEILDAGRTVRAGVPLLESGAAAVVVTLGRDGAVLNAGGGAWVARPPTLKTVSSVGSGDAFLGGLAFALEAGHSPEAALRHAVAAGAANALHFGGGMFTRPEFERLAQAVTIVAVS